MNLSLLQLVAFSYIPLGSNPPTVALYENNIEMDYEDFSPVILEIFDLISENGDYLFSEDGTTFTSE